ncbi:11906_t:CDS:2, partial [Acaulospora colombiana]
LLRYNKPVYEPSKSPGAFRMKWQTGSRILKRLLTNPESLDLSRKSKTATIPKMLTVEQVTDSIQGIPFVYKGLFGILIGTLDKIPTYGGILSFSSILSTIRLAIQGADPWVQAYMHSPMIRVPSILGWRVVVQHQFFNEVIRAPEDVLSFEDFIADHRIGPESSSPALLEWKEVVAFDW